MRAISKSEKGFTLLEVLVAIAILSMGFIVLLDSQGGSVKMSLYAKDLTIATQLARAKISELHQKLEDGKVTFNLSKSYCKSGDFSEEGKEFKRYKWRWCWKKVEMAAPTNIPGMGGGGDSDSSDSSKSSNPANALMGALGMPQTSSSSAGSLAGSLGPFMGIMKTQMKALFEQLQESLREIQVEVSWGKGRNRDKVTLVTHIFNFDPVTGFPRGWPEKKR